MYDIRQFKSTVYLLVMLGITGFAVAAQEPELWVLAIAGVLLNAWLVLKKKFLPMPRWVASAITLVSMAYVTFQVWTLSGTPPILRIGQFLVLLQIVKLFEQRANRDYAQLLVLSWLLMVAAAISTASLGFAILFFLHLVLLLYGCLLYHLKVETDRAKAAQTLPEEKLNAAILRQDQRYLARSMRRLTGLVAVVSLTCAIFIFLFFPRGSGAGMFGQLQLHPPETLTGFSDEVQQNQIAKITQDNTPVATVKVTHNGQLMNVGALRLRGATFDVYEFNAETGESRWETSKAHLSEGSLIGAGESYEDHEGKMAPLQHEWRQVVRLEPIGSKALFALAGIHSIKVGRETKIAYYKNDETIQRTEGLLTSLEYEVVSNNVLTPLTAGELDNLRFGKGALAELVELTTGHLKKMRKARSDIAPEIEKFAADPAVCGLADVRNRRPREAGLTDIDEDIAMNIQGYFRGNFTYSLDLTDAADLFQGKDPLVVFVTQTKRGHCQYFAGAMTLACQSLGLKARLVTGFNTDEYNRYSEVFQVRRSHAHAWVEVLTPNRGWVAFDPTSGREYPPNESRSAWQIIKHVFDWMEYKWGSSVVAYSGNNRDNLIQKIDNKLLTSAYRGHERIGRLGKWWESLKERSEFWTVSSKLLAGFILVMAGGMIGLIVWFVSERYRIRRRAAKIGLDALPMTERIRMARQLGFYEEMVEVLRRHHIARPPHLTPREFTRTLTFLPTEAFDRIDRLTRIFYRVRYGGASVQAAQQRKLMEIVGKLDHALAPPKEI